MLDRLNGIVEDVGGCIGYSATAALVDWFGGGNLYIPQEAEEAHAICKIIGMPAMRRLCQEWGGQEIWLPLGYQREQDRRDRMIAVMLELGLGSKQVASIAGMSERHVQHIRFRLEELGVMPLILSRAGLGNRVAKPGLENRVAKPGLENRVPKLMQKPGAKTRIVKKGKRAW